MKMATVCGPQGSRSPRTRLGGALGGLGGVLLLTSLAQAQTPDSKPVGGAPLVGAATAPDTASAVTVAPATAPPATTAPAAADAKPTAADAKPGPSAAEKHLADIEERLAAVERTQSSSEKDDSKNLFRIYGFTDVGVQRTWISEKSIIAPYIASSNATNFVVGNLNLYLDAQPRKTGAFSASCTSRTVPQAPRSFGESAPARMGGAAHDAAVRRFGRLSARRIIDLRRARFHRTYPHAFLSVSA